MVRYERRMILTRTSLPHRLATLAVLAAAGLGLAAAPAAADVTWGTATTTVHSGEFCSTAAHGQLVTVDDRTYQCSPDTADRLWRWRDVTEPAPSPSTPDTAGPSGAACLDASGPVRESYRTPHVRQHHGYGTAGAAPVPTCPASPSPSASTSPAATLPVTGDNVPVLAVLGGSLVLTGWVLFLALHYYRRGRHAA